MKAMIYQGPMQLAIATVPKPSANHGEAVVAVRACGLCGSDIHGLTGKTGRRSPGMIWGHEASGVIDSLGYGVEDLALGDRVILFPCLACGTCACCARGEINQCYTRQFLGVNFPGAFSEYVKVPASLLISMPDTLSFEMGALAEPLAVAMHAVTHAPVHVMDTAVILGAGTIGLMVMLAARMAGAANIIMVDKNARRLKVAQALGADATIEAGAPALATQAGAKANLSSCHMDPVDAIMGLTNGRGADWVVEAAGLGITTRQSISMAKPGGHVTWLGNSTKAAEIDIQDVVQKGLTISGRLAYTRSDFDRAIAAIAASKVNLLPLIEARVSLQEMPALALALASGSADLLKAMMVIE